MVKSRRLLIQATVVIEMALLTACGLWWGLCLQQDELCTPFLDRGRLQKQEVLPPLLSSEPSSSKRLKLRLTLQLEDGGSWKLWTDALNRWIEEKKLARWPLWVSPPKVNVEVGGSLSSKATRQDENMVAAKFVSKEIIRSRQEDELELIIYVPRVYPLRIFVEEQQAISMQLDDWTVVTILQESGLDTAMTYLMPLLQKHGVNSSSNETLTAQELQGWLQAVVYNDYQRARHQLAELQTKLRKSDTAEQWTKAAKSLGLVRQQLQEGSWKDCMKTLETVQSQVEELELDSSLIPPLHFQWDHCLAIFAPLMFPLLIPMIAGLIREYKRFKKLQKEEAY
jgi:hypothetical protein